MTDAQLIEAHGQEMSSYSMPYDFYLTELARRDSARRERRMLWMTAAIVVLTLANAVLVAVSVLR